MSTASGRDAARHPQASARRTGSLGHARYGHWWFGLAKLLRCRGWLPQALGPRRRLRLDLSGRLRGARSPKNDEPLLAVALHRGSYKGCQRQAGCASGPAGAFFGRVLPLGVALRGGRPAWRGSAPQGAVGSVNTVVNGNDLIDLEEVDHVRRLTLQAHQG